jgi:hypothetical protein
MSFYANEKNFIGNAMLPGMEKGEACCIHFFRDSVFIASRKKFMAVEKTNGLVIIIGGVTYRLTQDTFRLVKVGFSGLDMGMPVTLSTEKDGLITIPHPELYCNRPAWTTKSTILIGQSKYIVKQEEHDPIGVMSYLEWVE